MKKLMIIVLGVLLFTACSNYSTEPLSSIETIELAHESDTTQYVVVEDSKNNTTYFKVTEKGLIPEVKIYDEDVAGPIILILIIGLFVFGLGYAAGDS